MPKIKTAGKIWDTSTGYDFRQDKPLSPRRAMRKKCLECCCGSSHEVKVCVMPDCPPWPYRNGQGHLHRSEGRDDSDAGTQRSPDRGRAGGRKAAGRSGTGLNRRAGDKAHSGVPGKTAGEFPAG